MNRRELFKSMAAALAAVAVPCTVEALAETPNPDILRYLRRVQQNLMTKVVNPPMIMREDGTVTTPPMETWHEALTWVNRAITELERHP